MIDVHTHVLPGIDDGAADLAEAVSMCRLAGDDGVETVFVTPHQRHAQWPNEDPSRLESLRQTVALAAGGRPRLLLGAEIRVDAELLDELGQPAAAGLLPLAGSRYLLLEMPGLRPRFEARELVREIALAGWVPLLAHPERLSWLADEPRRLAELVERGALVQVTAGSVLGEMGPRAQECCEYLLNAGLVHFLASDAHDAALRPPTLSTARRFIRDGWGEEVAELLTTINPACIISNRLLGEAA